MSNFDPLDLRGQEEAREQRKLSDRVQQSNEDIDIKWLMGSKRGRRIVWRLLDQAGVFRLSFNTNSMQMAFAEGNRNYGNRLLNSVYSICPELFPTMLKENNQHDRNADDGRSHNDH